MGWMDKLYETYENNAHLAGVMIPDKVPFCPVFHILAKAQIEITINEEGDFLHAEKVEKGKEATFIPATEESAGRSSGIAPHPLCDTLSYVAGDYAAYKKEDKKCAGKNKAYLEQLKTWSESEYSHPKVKAIYQYCIKNTTIHDLVLQSIVNCDNNGNLSDEKIEGMPYEKCMVRWRVLSKEDVDCMDATWEDKTLFESYISYQSIAEDAITDICYVSGKKGAIAVNHPKGIVASYGAKLAKLLSANDTSGFVFRGRFSDAAQAYAVSVDVTQKVHNVLRWLVANQGVYFGERTIVCWSPKGKPVLNIRRFGGQEDEEEQIAYSKPIYQQRLRKAMNGYRNQFTDKDEIIVMALEAATTGRLSITYYNELYAYDYFDRIEQWQNMCCWYYTRFDQEGKPKAVIETPSIDRIIEYAFGTEQGQFVKVDDKVMKEQAQRIVHCILDKEAIPFDIVHALAMKASKPMAYSFGNHEKILSTACAFINCYNEGYKGEEQGMNLDKSNQNRSYLFGRLLAVAEKVERSTYTREENRETNAIRLQAAFQQHPMHTWRVIQEDLRPYFQRLHRDKRDMYNDLIGEIWSTFQAEDEVNLNLKLDDIYLVGYYLQRKELNKNKKQEEE